MLFCNYLTKESEVCIPAGQEGGSMSHRPTSSVVCMHFLDVRIASNKVLTSCTQASECNLHQQPCLALCELISFHQLQKTVSIKLNTAKSTS